MKTLTGSTTTEKNKTNPGPQNILKIEWGGAVGDKYYADQDMTSPVVAAGKVLDWGNFTSQLVEEKGQISDITIRLHDTDMVILGYLRAVEAQEKICYLYQYFSTTLWADACLLLKGTIKEVAWKEETPEISFQIENIQAYYDKQLGTEAKATIFTQIKKDSEGKILPLVFGKAENVAAVQVIESARTSLVVPCTSVSTTMIVADSREFVQGTLSNIDIFVGRELVRGHFEGAKLTLLQRGKVIATGMTAFVGNGRTFLANLTPNGPNWIGFRVKFFIGSQQLDRVITNYTSPNVYGIDANLYVPASVYFEIYTLAENHAAGEEVYERLTEYKWILNDAPSTSLEKVEIEASILIQGANTSEKVKDINFWARLDDSYGTVNLNDATWVATLGHNVTTLSLPFDPKNLPNTPYRSGEIRANFVGVNNSNPVDILVNLAVRLGFTYPTDFDTVSETAVKASLGWLPIGFAITEKVGLEVLYDIAFQCRVSIIFEQSKWKFRYLENKVGISVATLADSARVLDSVEVSQEDNDKIINKIVAKFKEYGVDKEIIYPDAESIAKFGEKEKVLDLWCHNRRVYASAIAQFYLHRWINAFEIAKFTTFLNTLEAEKSDWITLNFTNFYTSQPAEILNIEHQAGSKDQIDQIKYIARVPKFAGCASTCEAYAQTGCASACQECCQTGTETTCNYACETAVQDACSLTCVTVCELSCIDFCQGAGCQLSSQTCRNQCQTGQTTSSPTGCEMGCQIGCTTGEQTCNTSCQVGCTTGGCMTGVEGCLGLCMTSCQASACMTGCTTSDTVCFSTCQGACTTGGCTTSCQAACTTGAETCAGSCTACCQGACTSSCEDFCRGGEGACQSGCTAAITVDGFTSCSEICEISCRGSCEGHCQDCCQADGSTTAYVCSTICQANGCMQNCQTSAQSTPDFGPGICATSCRAVCMTSATTGCGEYCTVGCQCFCQVSCEQSCRTAGACMTDCQCLCQTSEQASCGTSNEGGICATACLAYTQTGCNSGCQTGCQAYPMTGAEGNKGCALFCTTGCMCNCQLSCLSFCRSTACETSCTCDCRSSVVVEMGSNWYPDCLYRCQSQAQILLCVTACRADCTTSCMTYCQTTTTTNICATSCRSFAMTGGCSVGCEVYCRVGCMCDCMATCRSNCRASSEANCMCDCQTESQV